MDSGNLEGFLRTGKSVVIFLLLLVWYLPAEGIR